MDSLGDKYYDAGMISDYLREYGTVSNLQRPQLQLGLSCYLQNVEFSLVSLLFTNSLSATSFLMQCSYQEEVESKAEKEEEEEYSIPFTHIGGRYPPMSYSRSSKEELPLRLVLPLEPEKGFVRNLGIVRKFVGLIGLWRGVLTEAIRTTLHMLGTNMIRSVINIAGPFVSSWISEGIMNFALIPFAVVRCRLVAQHIIRKEREYGGMSSAFYSIYKSDDGFYRYPLFYCLYSFMQPSLKWVLLCRADDPLLHRVIFFSLFVLIDLPMQVIFHRLVLQGGDPKRYCISISSTPYNGSFDALKRIIKEEGGGILYSAWMFRTLQSFAGYHFDPIRI